MHARGVAASGQLAMDFWSRPLQPASGQLWLL
jgi:hypothetical protein